MDQIECETDKFKILNMANLGFENLFDSINDNSKKSWSADGMMVQTPCQK